jgi:hypothetical protein
MDGERKVRGRGRPSWSLWDHFLVLALADCGTFSEVEIADIHEWEKQDLWGFSAGAWDLKPRRCRQVSRHREQARKLFRAAGVEGLPYPVIDIPRAFEFYCSPWTCSRTLCNSCAFKVLGECEGLAEIPKDILDDLLCNMALECKQWSDPPWWKLFQLSLPKRSKT